MLLRQLIPSSFYCYIYKYYIIAIAKCIVCIRQVLNLSFQVLRNQNKYSWVSYAIIYKPKLELKKM